MALLLSSTPLSLFSSHYSGFSLGCVSVLLSPPLLSSLHSLLLISHFLCSTHYLLLSSLYPLISSPISSSSPPFTSSVLSLHSSPASSFPFSSPFFPNFMLPILFTSQRLFPPLLCIFPLTLFLPFSPHSSSHLSSFQILNSLHLSPLSTFFPVPLFSLFSISSHFLTSPLSIIFLTHSLTSYIFFKSSLFQLVSPPLDSATFFLHIFVSFLSSERNNRNNRKTKDKDCRQIGSVLATLSHHRLVCNSEDPLLLHSLRNNVWNNLQHCTPDSSRPPPPSPPPPPLSFYPLVHI